MGSSMGKLISPLVMAAALSLAACGDGGDEPSLPEGCVDTLLHGFVEISDQHATGLVACLEQTATGDLTESIDECLHADPTGAIAEARSGHIDSALEACSEPALGFGPRSAASANATAIRSQAALLAGVLGEAAHEDGAVASANRDVAMTRVEIHSTLSEDQRDKLQYFRRCTREGLDDGSIVDEAGIANCADRVVSERACHVDRLERQMAGWQERGVDLAAAFPGCSENTPEATGRCVCERLECQVCLATNRVGFVDRDCDVIDDGHANRSCQGIDRWGGHTSIESVATGRFRVEQIDGVWHFITPDGHGFFSAGVTSVNTGAYSPPVNHNPYEDNIVARYGSLEAWREHAIERLDRWNFNTTGAWSSFASASDGRLAYTPILSFHSSAPEIPDWPPGQTGKRVRDFFDPEWPAAVAQYAENARPCAEDPLCIGVFTDNEMPWGPSVFIVGTYLDAYISLPPNAPGKLEVQAFFEQRYSDVTAFNTAWGLGLADFDEIQDVDSLGSDIVCESLALTADRRAFLVRVAERYFSTVHDALRGIDPALLNLGPRFATTAIGPDVVQTAAPYLDVISLNHYILDPAALNIFAGSGGALYDFFFIDNRFDDLAEVHALSGLPMMITEYTTRVPTPDVSVLFPPYFPTYPTQEKRTDAYEEYQRQVLSRPFMIGTHWFQWEDQPETGRGDGENSHFGVVNIDDDPYELLTGRMTHLNSLTSQRPLPPPDVVFFPDPVSPTGTLGELTSATTTAGPVEDGALGVRAFSIAPVGSDRTGFYIGLLPGSNLGSGVAGGPLILSTGIADAGGEASLTLAEDTIVAVQATTGELLCLRLAASGSSGLLSCQGGTGHDVVVTRDTGQFAPPETTAVQLGSDAGPGAATLLVSTELARLPPGSGIADCHTTLEYEAPNLRALSTATVTVTKGDEAVLLIGENFECGVDGAAWRAENGAGVFAIGLPMFDARVPGGDLAAGLLLADQADTCP